MDSTLEWLLQEENPSVRYFTLRHLLDRPETDAEVQAARRAIMHSEPVKRILAAQAAEGYWVKPGPGYTPKYQSTVWQVLFLAELGADGSHPQVRQGCEYLLAHAQSSDGGFSALANAAPSGAAHCLNGNLIWALTALGYGHDKRLGRAVDWLAGATTGDDFSSFYASSVPGPGFRCSANGKLPCAWGAVKALRALASLPPALMSPQVKKAKAATVEFLLSHDLAKADYPYTVRVSGEWFKFGFPLSYTSDVLEAMFALGEAGHGRDPRLANGVALVLSQRDTTGRWTMRHSLNGKMWADIETKRKPSKWVTLRALSSLKLAGLDPLAGD